MHYLLYVYVLALILLGAQFSSMSELYVYYAQLRDFLFSYETWWSTYDFVLRNFTAFEQLQTLQISFVVLVLTKLVYSNMPYFRGSVFMVDFEVSKPPEEWAITQAWQEQRIVGEPRSLSFAQFEFSRGTIINQEP